jgi:hypothetical protein
MPDAHPREIKRYETAPEQNAPGQADWRATLPEDWTAPGRDASAA